ncbi:T9SS type A sorting domain-containing protein [Winogradskyella sp. 3972H.M.0a.05]|uniref:T9SS type A sorting domain-containing protein n=1 Tax=Winogradskyella sp. 3972H.M.0a.05 TaxID=2950277 RepID=UPI003391C825
MKNIATLFLFLLFQVSTSQNYTEYHTGSTTDVNTNHEFGICMMGGASENDNAMIWFLNRTNGGDVVVLRASGSNGYNNYMYSELGVTINSVTTFVIHNTSGAIDPYVLDKVAKAEAIWFAGGDQFDYVTYFKDNAMEDTLNNFINNKQGVIGGTSAGMAILGSSYFSAENGTVTNAQALSNPYHNRMTLGYDDFLTIPYLQGVITDTHYDDPDRRARHATFLARYATDNNSSAFGIACNEYTSVCIDDNGMARVYGEYPTYPEYAFFLQSNCTNDFLPETCVSNEPLTWNRAGEAIKVAKIPGTETGENYIDIGGWNLGAGQEWENWYVNSGTFSTDPTINPQCDLLGINEANTFEITVSPNPFSDEIVIHADEEENLKYNLYNALGKQFEIDIKNKRISTSKLSSGVYFLAVSKGHKKQTLKLIKQ